MKTQEFWNPARAKLELDKVLAERRAGSDIVSRAVWPVPGGRISQGVVPGHTAIDIVAALGAPVVATHPGRVTAVYPWSNGKRGYGRNVRILMADGIEAIYAHLQNYVVKVGDILKPGQQVGAVGATGTKVPHLHLEYRQPGADVFDGKWSTTTAVDPLPFLTNVVSQAVAPITQAVSSIRATAPPRLNLAADTINIPTDTPDDDNATRFGVGVDLPVVGRIGVGVKVDPVSVGDVFGIGDVVEKIKPSVERVMYGVAGYALILVGLIILVFSFRNEIRSAAKYTTDLIKPVTEVIPG